ncbi:MAG: Cytidylate kinase [uncultured Chloroflexi bacterium]|uniref:Cytidylate kinase n=1 Tax=uncultured Chloroflexota bacterium TaxID=166587 RepID=A0A6J4JDZ3_9CHLR|nr:MAG: Cytidylate kinase [uncultured Chloroflexota bacterium]
MNRALTIAIDGPAASGKSTLGAALAERLGYTYFDSGVVYRALTWLALERGVDVRDEMELVRLAESARIEVVRPTAGDGRQYTVLVDGQDATWSLRTPAVDHNVSVVAAHPGVRRAMTEWLRQIAGGGAMVMVGRDIGTVVLPGADLKVYLTATGEERARRRYREQLERSLQAEYDQILAEMRRRDELDSGRAIAPLRPAPDAIILDSDHLTVDEEIDQVLQHLALSEVATR